MFEPLIIIGTLFLWLLLLFILIRGAYRATCKHQKVEAVILAVIALVLIVLTSQYMFFFAWAAGCEMGWPIGCRM